MINKSYYFLNLGCPKNQTDGDYVRGALSGLGMKESDDPEGVDYIFVNTCAFIEQARLETRGEIEQLLPYKKNGTQLIALGCYPALGDVRKEIPGIDAAFRFDEKEKVLRYVTGSNDYCYRISPEHRMVNQRPYAYVVISEGCNNRCSYCSIPDIRGKYRSRLPEKIIEEVEYLASNDVKEVVLVAQDTTLYGRDLAEAIDLPGLCRSISAVDGIEWIRVMYAHPAHLDENMIDRLYENDKVCRYLDMPIQHISGEVLSRMGRRCDSARIRRLIKHLRNLDENISLRTTLMVGFPGETDDDYKALLDFMEEVQFDYLGAFGYSPETNTPAFEMPDRIDPELVKERLDLLYEVAGDILLEKARTQIGKIERFLIDNDSRDEDGCLEARTYRQAPEIDGFYRLEGPMDIGGGRFVGGRITDIDLAQVAG
jgi:ribosomal protein S12 methylthiotransferase